jgi:N-methylhydantoinase B
MKLSPDLAVSVETPGAGGYGLPKERWPASIAEDAATGKYSAAFIRRHYQDACESDQRSDSQARPVRSGMEATA